MSPRLYRVVIPVNDIDRATEFYRAILDVEGERVSTGRHYFNCDGTILACYDPIADGDSIGEGWKKHSNQYIYFAVEDLERTFEASKKSGAIIEKEIAQMPWGEKLYYIKDPFGNPICFVDHKTIFIGSSSKTEKNNG
jgi:predicted enzyme related to lactoylglutathione lyase